MRIILLCNAQANQLALANKIAAGYNLVGIVVENKKPNKAKNIPLKIYLKKITHRLFFQKIIQAWWNMLNYYKQQYPAFPAVKIFETVNINDLAVAAFIKEMHADLVMVSGTGMIRKNLLSLPLPRGMINLHTGLSPYVKGAPNCTNWCIANNELHLIGNTVMWIDAGIDSGDLLTTATVGFSGKESLSEIHIKVMEEAHALYLKALQLIADHKAPRIKQNSIGDGITYYQRDWNFTANNNLLKNFSHFEETIHAESYRQKLNEIITISA